MAASEDAVTAVMETLGCERLEMVTRNGPAEVVCRKHNVYTPDFKVIRAGQWTDRGCPVAVAAADAAVDADRASIQAETLRGAARSVGTWYGDGYGDRELRDRADRIEGKP